MKAVSKKTKEFNQFRFNGLYAHQYSNNYMTMLRVSNTKSKIVVKVAESNIRQTEYGYLLILDNTHVVFLKPWQVSENYYGTEVVLDRNFFKPKEFGTWEDFGKDDKYLSFDAWLKVAEAQSALEEDGTPVNMVRWEI